MLNLFDQFKGWIIGAAVAFFGLIGVYLRGRSSGKAQERQDRATAVNKQQTEARQAVREIKDDLDKTDDAGLRDRASKWVRNK